MSSSIRILALVAVALPAAAGCRKQQESPPAPPAASPDVQISPTLSLPPRPLTTPMTIQGAPPAPTPPGSGPTGEDTEAVLAALDASANGLFAKVPDDGAAAPPAPPFERFRASVDVAALRNTPIWAMFETGFARYIAVARPEAGERPCVLDLIGKVTTAYADMHPDAERGGSSGFVVLKADVSAEEVKACMTTMLRSGTTLEEVEVAGRAGFSRRPDETPKVTVEAAPGVWIIGEQAAVESMLSSNAPFEPDASFEAAAAPLGSVQFRVVMTATDKFRAIGDSIDQAPVRCLRDFFGGARTLALGAGLSERFNAVVAVGYEDAAQAVGAQQCVQAIWNVMKPVVLSQIPPDGVEVVQEMLGMSVAEAFDLVEIRASGESVTVGVAFAADVFEGLVGLLMTQVASGPDEVSAIAPPPTDDGPMPAGDWTCPMHPAVRQGGPGPCPICGMALIREETPADPAR